AWREYLSLPLPVDSGKGALRLWMEVAKGEPRDLTADLVLVDVRTQLADDLPPLELARVSGRVGWKHDGGRHELYTKALAFEALGVNAQDLFPGASGIAGSFNATETNGTLKLASQRMTLDLPHVFAEPVALDSAAGDVKWVRTPETLQVRVDDLAFANGHAA